MNDIRTAEVKERQPTIEEIKVPQPMPDTKESAQTIEGYTVKMLTKDPPRSKASQKAEEIKTPTAAVTPTQEPPITSVDVVPTTATTTTTTTTTPVQDNTTRTRRVREKKKKSVRFQPEKPLESKETIAESIGNLSVSNTTATTASTTDQLEGSKQVESVKSAEATRATKPKKQYVADLSPFATIWLVLSTWVTYRTRTLLRNDVSFQLTLSFVLYLHIAGVAKRTRG